MLISYPFLSGRTDDTLVSDTIEQSISAKEGLYPVGFDRRWHGGIHLSAAANEPVRAIADGEVVAFRCASAVEHYQDVGDFDSSFVLLKHSTQTGESTPVEFYSLYMHLQSTKDMIADLYAQLPAFIKQAKAGPGVVKPTNVKVYRKDVLGFVGTLYDRPTLHFEIFTTDDALAKFWSDSTSTTSTGSPDFYGDAHFIIPAGKDFLAKHPNDNAGKLDLPGKADFPLPAGVSGKNSHKLYVTVRLERGTRSSASVAEVEPGKFQPLAGPVEQPDYEYELYRLATALYPDCPSAGYEWLRFGRVLGPDSTSNNTNWQAVRFEDGKIGYIDLAQADIIKLSDADFPHWQGWRKIEEGQTHNAQDGICDIDELLAIIRIEDEDGDGQITDADKQIKLSRSDIRDKLQYLVVKHPSEWDKSSNDAKYAALRKPGEALENPEDWDEFKAHIEKMQFWTDAGLGEPSVWHFHPIAFIRHMRKCGWLSPIEFAQCLPRKNLHFKGTKFHEQLVANWETAYTRSVRWSHHLSRAARKYLVPANKLRLVHFFSQVIEESGYLRLLVEGGGSDRAYAPWYGRGLIQLTHLGNYQEYGRFRAFAGEGGLPPAYQPLGWNPDARILQNDANCADSAGFYWVCTLINALHKHMSRMADMGLAPSEVLAVSRGINGNVAVQKVNGLDIRNQLVVFLKYILMDNVLPTPEKPGASAVEPLTFVWRNRSSPPPFVPMQHSINVILTPQRK